MALLSEFLRKLRFFAKRDQFERDLDEEMSLHRSLMNEQRGTASFGNVTLLKEESRAVWTWTSVEQFSQDVRYAVRAMSGNRLFTAMAALSLALGIGANTAIYSFMDAVLLRSLPVRNPEQLVSVNWRAPKPPGVIHGQSGSRFREGKTGMASPNYPYAAFEALRSQRDVLSDLFAYASAWQITVIAKEQAEIVDIQLASGGYFKGLGVVPAAGRLLGGDDDRPGAAPVAVISHSFWQRHFALNPAAVGQTIRLNNVLFTIVGVTPREFFGVNPGQDPPVYIPLRAASLFAQKPAEDEKRRFLDANFYWVEMMGRLRPGVSLVQAQASLAERFRQYALGTATKENEKENLPALWLDDASRGLASLRREYSEPLYVLMLMVGILLLIACVNIANLLLARSAARRREIAVRISLGAGRWRVIRQLLTETVLLSILGGALGLFIAYLGIRLIIGLLANGSEPFDLYVTLNWNVLAFAFALSVITGILFGLAPALQTTRVDLAPALKEARSSAQRGRGFRFGLGRALVASQIALSLLLVVASGLFVRTLHNLYSVDLGFNKENVLIFSLNGRPAGYKEAELGRFYAGLLTRLRRIPGVREGGLAQYPLAVGYISTNSLNIPGVPVEPGKKPLETSVVRVDASFLETMQIPIVLGSGFGEEHMTSNRVAIVNEAFAKEHFAGQNPVGRYFGLGDAKKPADIQIIGVAKSARYNSIKEEKTPGVAYIPYTMQASGLGQMYFHLRTAGDPLAISAAVRQAVREANPLVPVANLTTHAARIDETISRERTFGTLCTWFAALALLLACIGLYGTMAYSVARRTNEIGIRMALGAGRRRIVTMVAGEMAILAGAGLAAGLGATWAMTRLVESFLFRMHHRDPLVLTAAIGVLTVAAAAAGLAPALRASRIDPLTALRHE